MGDPIRIHTLHIQYNWDRANRNDNPGKHMMVDMNGNNLKLKDLRNGMKVKIKAYKPSYIGYEYLYTTETGKYARTHNIKVMQ